MIRLSEFVSATHAHVTGPLVDRVCTGFAYDSRTDCRDRIFLALRTETGDGHDYIGKAIANGAIAVVCERVPAREVRSDVPYFIVPNVLVALGDWARQSMAAWHPRTICVAGSLGKTTTKELIASVLSPYFSVAKTAENLSGILGLPVAIAEMNRESEVAVLEFASDSFGEMRAMCSMAPPQIAVITNINERHLSVFGSLDNIAGEISSLFHYLTPGVAVLNRDDERVWAMRRHIAQYISFGMNADADVRASAVELTSSGLRFRVETHSVCVVCEAPLFSPVLVYNCLAAIATGIVAGCGLEDNVRSLSRALPVPGRLNLLSGPNKTFILDDTFSSSPTSVRAALEGLRAFPSPGRRLIVLGGMDDLPDIGEIPRDIALAISEVAGHTYTLGDSVAGLAALVRSSGSPATPLYSLADLEAALARDLQDDDLILIKGNRASRLERLVASLAADMADSLPLVRQEPHWDEVKLARPERPTWVEIDVEALARNTAIIADTVRVPLMAVLKADAYGHGAVRVARVVMRHGASMIGVACLSEAKILRQSGIEAGVLVLGYTPPWQMREALRHGVALTMYGLEEAEALSRAAVAMGRTAIVHVKVDSGMNRLGLPPGEVVPFVERLGNLEGLVVEGIFTHFGNADDLDKSGTLAQLERFREVISELEGLGLRPRVVHAANTAAALALPESRFDMVRVGIGLYGLRPSIYSPLPDGIRPVLTMKTTVSQVKDVQAGAYVGYGKAFRATSPLRIAVIPVGYADGFRRGPNNWGEVLVRGQRCSLIGNVCMDQAMVDVSHVPGVRKGDEVVLIGSQGEATIDADEVAARLGTINYEVVSQILARVPRIS